MCIRTSAELTSHRRPARDLRLCALAFSVGVVSASGLNLIMVVVNYETSGARVVYVPESRP